MSSVIGGAGAVSTNWSQAPVQASRPSPLQMLKPAADLLGTTPKALMTQLQSGSTLAEVAGTKGVSRADLLAAVEQGLKGASANGAPQGIAKSSLTTVAGNIADGRVAGTHRHHAQVQPSTLADGDTSNGSEPTTTLGNVASVLGMDQRSLLESLASGTSLFDLATSKGVAPSSVQSALSTGQPGQLVDLRA